MENGQDCRLFCDGPAFPYLMHVSDRAVWQSFITVHLFWQFATMKGQVIVANQPDTFILGMQNEHSMQLNIRWNGNRWDVTPARQSDYSINNDPVCEAAYRSEEHTSELQSHSDLVCRLLLEKKKNQQNNHM